MQLGTRTVATREALVIVTGKVSQGSLRLKMLKWLNRMGRIVMIVVSSLMLLGGRLRVNEDEVGGGDEGEMHLEASVKGSMATYCPDLRVLYHFLKGVKYGHSHKKLRSSSCK